MYKKNVINTGNNKIYFAFSICILAIAFLLIYHVPNYAADTEEIEDVREVGELFGLNSNEIPTKKEQKEMKCRLIVSAILSENYGAEKVYFLPDYEQTILEFENISQTQKIYDQLKENYDCFIDACIRSEDILSTCHSWGATPMGFQTVLDMGEDKISQSDLTIAMLDTGIDTEHALFSNRVDMDHSYNFADGNTDIYDSEGHGTAVGGIIADLTPADTKILCCKIFNDEGYGSKLTVYSAFLYALGQGVDVINFSASWENESSEGFLNAVFAAANDAGIPVVVAAGNDGLDVNDCYPANQNNVITVGALSTEDEIADYSNTGHQIDFVAPATDVEVARANTTSKYTTMSGTSLAAPHISACIALIKASNPGLSVEEVYNILKKNCLDLGDTGRDDVYGYGLPDITDWYTDLICSDAIHSYGKEVIPATCTEDGNIIYTCKKDTCQKIVKKSLKASGHIWQPEVAVVGNYAIMTCSVCGEEKKYAMSGLCGESMAYELTWNYSSAYDEYVCHLNIKGSGKMTEYGENQFPWSDYVTKIKSISMGYAITSVSDYAFKGTEDLTSSNLTLPSSLTSIGKEAFSRCLRLSEFTIGENVSQIGDGAFAHCPQLKSFKVDENNSSFFTIDGLLYDSQQTTLYSCATKNTMTEISLPETVTRINPEAFSGCSGISKIILSENESFCIGKNAFQGVFADVIYHYHSDKWDDMILSSYGGRINWIYDGVKTDLSDVEIQISDDTFPYEGIDVCPSAEVYLDGEKLQEDRDYKLGYENNTQPGTANVIISGTGYYKGNVSKNFTIVKGTAILKISEDILEDHVLITGIGTSINIPVKAYLKDNELKEASGSSLTYTLSDESIAKISEDGSISGVKKGEASLTVSLKNDKYYEDVETSINVQVKEGFDTLEAESTFYYTEEAICPDVTVKAGESILAKDVDYRTSYENNIEPGIATITVKGIGNYGGCLKKQFVIKKQTYDMSDISFKNQNYPYDGTVHSLSVEGNLPDGVTVSYSGNEEQNAGTYIVTAVFQGDQYHETIPSMKATMTILPIDLSNYKATMSFDDSMDVIDSMNGTDGYAVKYNGTEICPDVIVEGVTADNYRLQYQDNEDVGMATIIVTGVDNYTGEIFLTFQILDNEMWDDVSEDNTEDSNEDNTEDSNEDNTEDISEDFTEDDTENRGENISHKTTNTVASKKLIRKIVISGESHKIAAGRKTQLKVSVSPKNSSNKEIRWISSDSKIATVSQKGIVTMKKKSGGKSVTITACSTDGSGIKTTYKIKSMKGYIKSIRLSGSKSVKAGKRLSLKAKIKTKGKAYKGLRWTCSNTKYATVSSKGIVKTNKAAKGKKLRIMAYSLDGTKKKASFTLNIR